MIVLGIETTCDETAVAIVRDGKEIVSEKIASSADIHAQYGGVFPELACRRHLEAIIPVLTEVLGAAKVSVDSIDAVAFAKEPGLIGALLIGMQTAEGLSIAWNKPCIPVNHVEAHLYASAMSSELPIELPALGLVLSGGHTLLVTIEAPWVVKPLATTVDDAIGEAFDKVAVLLGYRYPGG
ncbi:MAG: hypothetical protein RL235_303, partial [Chlamydiota bacterium]